MSTIQEVYPILFDEIKARLEASWETTFNIINQGVAEGVLKPINIIIFKTMFEATVEKCIIDDSLINDVNAYNKALNDMVAILLLGIKA